MTSTANHADFALMEEVHARELLSAAILGAGKVMRLCILAPVYPALGCGTLRILRVRPASGDVQTAGPEVIEVLAGYESYERLEL